MTDGIIIALIALVGTALGTLGGIITSSKLTMHRLEQLEKKVDKHNNMIERLYKVEERLKLTTHRLDELEERIK